MIVGSLRAPAPTVPPSSRRRRGAPSSRRTFVQGFATNVLNPKVVLFFLSFFPQFVADVERIRRASGVRRARRVMLVAISTVYNGLVAWLAGSITRRDAAGAARQGLARSLDRRGVRRARRAHRAGRPMSHAGARGPIAASGSARPRPVATAAGRLARLRAARRRAGLRRRARRAYVARRPRCRATGAGRRPARRASDVERPAGGDPRPRGADAAPARPRRRAARG